MGMTHRDDDTHAFIERLNRRAEEMRKRGESKIAGGEDGEILVAQWEHDGMRVEIRPDDPQDVLRISVGGGSSTPIHLDYCTVRGDVDACIALLEKAIQALRGKPVVRSTLTRKETKEES